MPMARSGDNAPRAVAISVISVTSPGTQPPDGTGRSAASRDGPDGDHPIGGTGRCPRVNG